MKALARSSYRLLVRLSKVLSRKGLYPFLEAEFSSIPPGSRVLTVGAGGGVNELLYRYARDREFHVTSFDVDESRGPDVVGDVCTYEFQDAEFDVVVICEVLEHLHSPHLAVARLYSALGRGGRLILTVPFLLPIHERPHDYFRYTRYGLQFLLRDYDELQIRERNSWAEAVNVIAARLAVDERARSRLVAPLFVALAFINLPFVWMIGRLVPTDFATTGYLVSARKGERA